MQSSEYGHIDLIRSLRVAIARVSTLVRIIFVVVSLIPAWTTEAVAGTVGVKTEGNSCILSWQGDEHIEVSFSRKAGLLRSPVKVRVDQREISFDGFYVAFNEEKEGYRTRSIKTDIEKDGVRVTHVLEHPKLQAPIRVVIKTWMVPENKTIRFEIETENGNSVHLDRLGIGKHQGRGLEPTRMYLTKMFVLDAPIQPFQLKYTYNSTRYWSFTMASGFTEMIGVDSVPRGFDFDASQGLYDMYTYCDSPITYSFVFTGKGAQEAISHYRSTLQMPAPSTLSQLPGRVTVMTGYPIRERYEDFLDELTGRGVRDFNWMAYAPWPGDREIVEPYGALYSVYDMYTDLFAEGPRKVKGWTPEWVRYEKPGQMKRGYWNSTWCLPNLYIEMAQKREQGTLGKELPNRGFLETPCTRFYNLAIFKQEVHPSALYLDVHASKVPEHYWDHLGKHYPVAEQLRQEKKFFEWARTFLGNVPVYSEVDGEAFAGIMDAGIFSPWPVPEKLGIKCGSWEYYPFIDQVHRERLLNSGAGAPFALADYNVQNMGLAIQFGRPQVISAYPGTPLANVQGRVQLYYLSSVFHRMLGLSGMDRVDFDASSIHRQIASYSNGAKIWSNRGDSDWEVEGLTLPPLGYLIKGSGGFLQYRARKGNQIVDVVRSSDYQYFSAEKAFDFGPIMTNGALGVRTPSSERIVMYEVLKPTSEIRLQLDRLPGTHSGQKVVKVWALLTRGRKVEVSFPDIQQEGNLVRIRPVEMATAVGYEMELAKP